MTETRPLIRVDGITRTYGGVPVLAGISADIHPGVTAVVGPNGSGKSTLLRLLVGETSPIDGTVQYEGPNAPKRIGYLPQRASFRESFTARETLAFYARLLGKRPDGHLERVGLSDAADRSIGDLSGGMRRLLGIAQATIGDPPVLVLDEPTSGLDPTMRDRIFRLAEEYATAGTAVVVSTHDLDLVDRYADRVLCLRHGSVAASGSLSDLYAAHGVETATDLYRSIVHDSSIETDPSEEPTGSVHVTGVSDR
ncbi:ABC-type multidrug transport system, ATPase component [Halopenitus malekzadehii]|uniref:ABC-type multidrug transport system, ATPase component n=1 Tax=Halopenitus malekzadehii TaxID=1267564 RepID=A0A1H6HZB7_9EURY|nr:ABC transporter ATP-binding protein [Halopenitus malekzadehii]SEH41350.1 ABC-type multidrug transport system, ATPase component [Halopenitus malekzadehii]